MQDGVIDFEEDCQAVVTRLSFRQLDVLLHDLQVLEYSDSLIPLVILLLLLALLLPLLLSALCYNGRVEGAPLSGLVALSLGLVLRLLAHGSEQLLLNRPLLLEGLILHSLGLLVFVYFLYLLSLQLRAVDTDLI